ncbi:MAG TPA: kelch repeat-containing protein, partial [Candidatus Binataceae bacterium]|nr:kelch repeat-containing protein [Candidatus Binataceae bacterium]
MQINLSFPIIGPRLVLSLLSLTAGLLLSQPCLAAPGEWEATGKLLTARYSHTATLLPDGQVLVAAGAGATGVLASAELYNSASGTWTATGSLATARYQHTAILLSTG